MTTTRKVEVIVMTTNGLVVGYKLVFFFFFFILILSFWLKITVSIFYFVVYFSIRKKVLDLKGRVERVEE